MAPALIALIAAILSALSALIACLAARSARQALNAARQLSEQPSPVIQFPGTLTPEAEARIRKRLRAAMADDASKAAPSW